MLLKITGSILVILSGSLMGLVYGEELKTKVKLREEILWWVIDIENEIEYSKSTLYEILSEMLVKLKGETAKLTEQLLRRMDEDEVDSFYKIWKENFNMIYKDTPLKKDIKEFENIGKCLEITDINEKLYRLKQYTDLQIKLIEAEKKNIKDKYNIYLRLGMLTGIFVTIILL